MTSAARDYKSTDNTKILTAASGILVFSQLNFSSFNLRPLNFAREAKYSIQNGPFVILPFNG